MQMRVSDYIATRLEELGVRSVFMLSGGGMMHLIDAVGRIEGMRIICNHHEQASALAAEGYARYTGQLGVCYATSGPGATNLMTPLVECWQESVPVLFLTGQSKLSQTAQGSGIEGLRQAGTFQVDIVSMVDTVTKYTVMIEDPKKVRYYLEKAIHLAMTGRPGPVLLDVPLDVQAAPVDPETLVGYDPEEDEPKFDQAEVREEARRIARLIAGAERPLLLAGHGIRTAGLADLFREVISAHPIPIVTTQLAMDLLPYDYPNWVGHCGPRADRAGNFAVQNATLIVTLGVSLHVTTTGYELDLFAPNAHKILVDPDPAIRERAREITQEQIAANLKDFIPAFLEALQEQKVAQVEERQEWLDRTHSWRDRFFTMNEPHKELEGGPINYYRIIHAIGEAMREEDVLITDGGLPYYIVPQVFRNKDKQRLIMSGAMGAMGHAMPMGTGICSVLPKDSPVSVVCIVGDGSLQTTIHELATVRHNDLPLKLFIVNNGGYVSIRNTQRNFFNGHLVGSSEDSGVWCPPLQGIAAAYGIPYFRSETVANLEEVIRQTLETEGPVLCEIMSDPNQACMPSVPAIRMPDGTMRSKQLHEMSPPLPEEVLAEVMYPVTKTG